MRAMKTTSLTGLVLFVLVVLLAASCQPKPIGPKTVLGPVSCEEKTRGTCAICTKASCCADLIACANSPPCPCWAMQIGRASPDEAFKVCGPAPANYTAFRSCLDAHCADECPRDRPASKHPLLDKPAPEILAEPLGGEGPTTLAEARGKVVILDFWATWCEPCKRSFPLYQKIADRYPRDVAVLAVAVDDPQHMTPERIFSVAKDHGARFPILWDRQMRMQTRYTMPNGLPTSFVIDRSGTVRSVHTGYDDKMPSAIEALVKSAPSTAQGDSPP
jgi:thiol-disulfide isomerase/thioredoxin